MEKILALELFHLAAHEVPAYQKFLKKRNVDPATITDWKEFQDRVPVMSKKNYLQKNTLANLNWGGNLNKPLEFCATSGSTSEPFYFPRDDVLAQQYADILENFVANSSHGVEGPTLVIVGFGMGVWIGGIITNRAFEILSHRRNMALSILPTGINKEEIFKGLIQLAPQFRQTILVGYPPFIRDIIDEAPARGIKLKKLNLRLLFAAESFNERFRDYLAKQSGISNPCLDTLNIYGSADIGAMARETPLSILIRRLATDNQPLFEAIFSQIHKTPTLAQYDPKHISFEDVDGQLVLTGNSALPLIRYAVGDRGGVLSYSKMMKVLAASGVDIEKEVHRAGIEQTIVRHPFVFVYERVDFAVSLYGATLYPEIVKDGLVDNVVSRYLTERFTMIVRYNDQQQQYLEINLEIRKDAEIKAQLERQICKTIFAAMCARSSEFREIAHQLKAKNVVRFVFWPPEHPLYFKPGVKQKWARQERPK
jgi:phenylacetate-CoA ligase